MARLLRLVLWASLGLPATSAACSVYGSGLVGGGGAGGASTLSTTSTGTITEPRTSSSTTSSTSSSTSSGAGGTLLLSQVQTRGAAGGDDEFVEIYNPTSAPVIFDATWVVRARSAEGGTTGCPTAIPIEHFAGAGQTIPAHGHILYANASSDGYSGSTAPDGTYTTGIPDAASIVLLHGEDVADALCFSYSDATETALTACSVPYTCEGTPAHNPHDDTTGTDTDASLERKPGGAGGNAQNTHDNMADFEENPSPDPHDLASAPTP